MPGTDRAGLMVACEGEQRWLFDFDGSHAQLWLPVEVHVARDIGFALLCVAAFATALAYVAYSGRVRSEREGVRIAQLEAQYGKLQQRFSTLAQLVGKDLAPVPVVHRMQPETPEAGPRQQHVRTSGARPGEAKPSIPSDGAALGVAVQEMAKDNPYDVRRAAARKVFGATFDQLRLEAARTLLEIDPAEGVKAIDALVAITRGRPRAARTALEALELLGSTDSAGAAAALHGYTRDRSNLVRVQAARVLARKGESGPIAQVTETLTRDLTHPDHRQRVESLALLGLAGQPSSIPEILPLLRDPDRDIRNRAVLTLGVFRDPSLARSVEPLLQDPAPEVRRSADRVLRGIR
jgi:hypothetical protein